MDIKIFLPAFIFFLFLNCGISFSEEKWPYKLYRANLHVHTSMSEKARHFGSLSKVSTIGKPINYYDHILADKPLETCKKAQSIGLNILGFSDHDCALTHEDWQNIDNVCRKTQTNNFLALRGFEWTPDRYNHINVFGSEKFVSARAQFVTYGLIGIDRQIKVIPDLSQFYSWLGEQCLENPYVVGQYNHPSDAKGEFDNFSSRQKPIDDFMALIELGSGPDLRHSSIDDNLASYIKALQSGRWLAPTIGVDNFGPITAKEARSRHTAVWLEKGIPLNEENIISALLQRKTYASENKDIVLKFWAKCEGDDTKYFLGDKCEIERGKDLNLFIEIQEFNESIGEIKIIEIRRNKKIETWFGAETKNVASVYYQGKKICHPSSDTICYLIIASEKDGEKIISAPIGVNVKIPDVIGQYEYKGDDPLQMLYYADDFKYKLIICDNYYQDEDGNLRYTEKSLFSYDNDDVHIIAQPSNLTQKYKLPCQLKILLYNADGELVKKHVLKVTKFPQKNLQKMDRRSRLPIGKYVVEGYVNNDLWERKTFQVIR